ncbi:hypothetical protein L2196_21470, partial [Xanthomonas perforans]|uniref:hypothetical protein n=1 Tax=Xanthomonas perforans TaxID=442694 RepID=UPI001F2EB5FF
MNIEYRSARAVQILLRPTCRGALAVSEAASTCGVMPRLCALAVLPPSRVLDRSSAGIAWRMRRVDRIAPCWLAPCMHPPPFSEAQRHCVAASLPDSRDANDF